VRFAGYPTHGTKKTKENFARTSVGTEIGIKKYAEFMKNTKGHTDK